MGFKRVVWSGIVGMIFLIPLAWISFSLLDLGDSLTGGFIQDFDSLIANLGTLLGSLIPGLGGIGDVLAIIGVIFTGLFLVCIFPIHWCLFYRPNDVFLLISVILPWILACTLASAVSAHSPRGGLHTSLAIGIGYIIIFFLLYFVIPGIINAFAFGFGVIISSILDGFVAGLTDLPFLLATFLAILEGCLVGAVFGAFIGSLKYKAGEGKVKVKKQEVIPQEIAEPILDSSEFCTNCGAKLPPDVDFCTNCGSKAIK